MGNDYLSLRDFPSFVSGWQLSDCGFDHYHLMRKSAIT